MLRRGVVAALVAVAAIATVAAPTVAAPRTGVALTGTETALLREVNRVRVQHGRATLRINVKLQRAARAHSGEMLRSGSFEHGDFAERLARFGIRGSLAGENLAWGVGSAGAPHELVLAWLRSPPHRANLLLSSYRRVGVGALVGSFSGLDGVTMVTADFAS